MIVQTTRFGSVEVNDDRVLNFSSGMLGFSSYTQFVLLQPDEDGIFFWLQSIEAPELAFVITDPQNDFLSPEGVTWGLVGESVEENGTVGHIQELLDAAKRGGYNVFVSPHYYYPTDKGWDFGGTVENMISPHWLSNRSTMSATAASCLEPASASTDLSAFAPSFWTVLTFFSAASFAASSVD